MIGFSDITCQMPYLTYTNNIDLTDEYINPTLFLTADEYDKKLKLNETKNDYILYFSYQYDTKLLDFANLVSVYYKLPVVSISNYPRFFFADCIESQYHMKPEQWLEYVKNAKIVLTDSYYGLMFSIVYRRPFYIYIPKKNYAVKILEILDLFGLENRRLGLVDSVDKAILDLDYTYTFNILKNEKERAIEFLSKSIIVNSELSV